MEVAAGVHELREVVSGRGGSQLQENENAPVHACLELSRSALLAQGLLKGYSFFSMMHTAVVVAT